MQDYYTNSLPIANTPSRYYMLIEDWQGAKIYDQEPFFDEFVYWPFGGHA
jgi:hypothetical protein